MQSRCKATTRICFANSVSLSMKLNIKSGIKIRQTIGLTHHCVGTELSSRAASRQVLSPQQSLTSVFGMGTGGPSALRAPTQIRCVPYFDVSNELSSRAASRRVLSPQQSLTSVFGMGTGGPSALRSLTSVIKKITENRINENSQAMCCCEPEP